MNISCQSSTSLPLNDIPMDFYSVILFYPNRNTNATCNLFVLNQSRFLIYMACIEINVDGRFVLWWYRMFFEDCIDLRR